MVVLEYEGKKYQIPESYNELTGYQLIALMPLLSVSDDDPDLIALKVLRVLLDMGKINFMKLHVDAKHRMIPYTTWVLKPDRLTKQLIPYHRSGFKKYYGPKSEFDNLTVREFHAAEIYYGAAKEKADRESLAFLAAVLYRPGKPGYDPVKDPDGDIRIPFNQHELEYWAKKFMSWPVPVLQAILVWYDGCKQLLVEAHPNVFKKHEGVETVETQERGVFNLMRTLADGGKYGDFERVGDMNIHLAMFEMEKLVIEQEAMAQNNTIS